MSNPKRVLRDYESVKVDVQDFDQIEGNYAYGEILRHMTDFFGVLYYEVCLRGTDVSIIVDWDKVQRVAEEDNKHDKHYLEAVVEPIKVMEKMFTKEELKGFIKGNILKYRLRMGHKDDIQKEMDKIRVYEQWLAKLERGEALIDEK